MTDLDLLQRLIEQHSIVQITVMPPSDTAPSQYSVILKGSNMRGFGVTLQDVFDDCKVILP